MLTHSHAIELFILICEEVKKIYRDHSCHPKLPLHCITILIYISQHSLHLLSVPTVPLSASLLSHGLLKCCWPLSSFCVSSEIVPSSFLLFCLMLILASSWFYQISQMYYFSNKLFSKVNFTILLEYFL